MSDPNTPPRPPIKVPPRRPLDYAAPPPSANTADNFFKRMLIGAGAGIVSLALGALLAFEISSPGAGGNIFWMIFFLPTIVLIIAAGTYTILKRRFGYVTGIITGIITAAGLIMLGLILLVLIICGGMLRR